MQHDAPDLVGDCKCGCGRPGILGLEADAERLGAAKRSVKALERRLAIPGKHSAEAAHLLWAWQQCSYGFEDAVHQTDEHEWMDCGPPTATWLNGWRERVAAV